MQIYITDYMHITNRLLQALHYCTCYTTNSIIVVVVVQLYAYCYLFYCCYFPTHTTPVTQTMTITTTTTTTTKLLSLLYDTTLLLLIANVSTTEGKEGVMCCDSEERKLTPYKRTHTNIYKHMYINIHQYARRHTFTHKRI